MLIVFVTSADSRQFALQRTHNDLGAPDRRQTVLDVLGLDSGHNQEVSVPGSQSNMTRGGTWWGPANVEVGGVRGHSPDITQFLSSPLGPGGDLSRDHAHHHLIMILNNYNIRTLLTCREFFTWLITPSYRWRYSTNEYLFCWISLESRGIIASDHSRLGIIIDNKNWKSAFPGRSEERCGVV